MVTGKVSRASYDRWIGVVWFVRGGRLEAIDLTTDSAPVVAIVEDMPDLSFDVPPGARFEYPACDACVVVAGVPRPEARVTTESRSGGQLEGCRRGLGQVE